MLTSIWRPQNAAPGGRCPPLSPPCYATGEAFHRTMLQYSLTDAWSVRYVFYNLCYELWSRMCIKCFDSRVTNIDFLDQLNIWVCFNMQKSPPGNRNRPYNAWNRPLGGDFAHVEDHCVNPRTQSALLGDRVSTPTSSLLNLLEMLLPPLDLYSIKPRRISWLLRWKVIHKLFTSSLPNRNFHVTSCVDSKQSFDQQDFVHDVHHLASCNNACHCSSLSDTVAKSLCLMLSVTARMNWAWLMTGPLHSLNCTFWNYIASSRCWAKI